jgi:hypothetical protein
VRIVASQEWLEPEISFRGRKMCTARYVVIERMGSGAQLLCSGQPWKLRSTEEKWEKVVDDEDTQRMVVLQRS